MRNYAWNKTDAGFFKNARGSTPHLIAFWLKVLVTSTGVRGDAPKSDTSVCGFIFPMQVNTQPRIYFECKQFTTTSDPV